MEETTMNKTSKPIKKEQQGSEVTGIVYGNVSNASTNVSQEMFNTPRGHGFAAENANHLADILSGKDAKLVGAETDATNHIIKNGADRIVNGVNIQTKYCSSGSKCISECFENGKFRYLNMDGTPMQIEVPSDKYDDAVRALQDRIKKGEVPGVSDPEQAKGIIRKGHFTYLQAKNIAKAGTIESLTFDTINGTIIASGAGGISASISFAVSIWNGEDVDVALQKAAGSGLKVFGTTFLTSVLTGQLTKAGLNSALVGSSEALVRIMGPKASAVLVNAFRSGTNIYGAAAMKSAAKLLRGNVITAADSVVVLSSVDIVNIFSGRISGKQLFKNLTNTTASVAGGTAGWVGGAAAGAAIGSVVPVIGTAIGGTIGGLLGAFGGGSVAAKASSTIMNSFVEDDADEMQQILEERFQVLAEDYLLNQKEATEIVKDLQGVLTGSKLKDMFASSDRNRFADNTLVPLIEKVVKKRPKIKTLSEEELTKGMRSLLEEIADEESENEFGNNLQSQKIENSFDTSSNKKTLDQAQKSEETKRGKEEKLRQACKQYKEAIESYQEAEEDDDETEEKLCTLAEEKLYALADEGISEVFYEIAKIEYEEDYSEQSDIIACLIMGASLGEKQASIELAGWIVQHKVLFLIEEVREHMDEVVLEGKKFLLNRDVYEEMEEWAEEVLEKYAEQGDIAAAYYLGMLCANNGILFGKTSDKKLAIKWLRQAQSGNCSATNINVACKEVNKIFHDLGLKTRCQFFVHIREEEDR